MGTQGSIVKLIKKGKYDFPALRIVLKLVEVPRVGLSGTQGQYADNKRPWQPEGRGHAGPTLHQKQGTINEDLSKVVGAGDMSEPVSIRKSVVLRVLL